MLNKFIPYGKQNITKVDIDLVIEALTSDYITQGPAVVKFEADLALYLNCKYVCVVSNGTAALHLASLALELQPGDAVIVPAISFVATSNSVLYCGATPIFADVDLKTGNISINSAEEAIQLAISKGLKPKAIYPVHFSGFPCDPSEIIAFAKKHNLKIVEDACHAIGAQYRKNSSEDFKMVGSHSDMAVWSFHPVKHITTGEGGMVITNDTEIWKRSLMYHDVGGPRQYNVPSDELLIGTNYRMPELLGAVALVQLRRLDGLLDAMRERKHMLKAGMAEIVKRKGLTFRAEADEAGDTAIALIFFAESMDSAGQIAKALRAENIGAGTLYRPDASDYHVYAHWTPIMEQRTWSPNGGPWRDAHRPITYTKDMCPRTLDLLGRAVHLNVSPLLTNEDIEETLEGVNRVLDALA